MTKPFKTVTTEYFEELDTEERQLIRDAVDRIRMVTTETRLIDRHGRPVGEKIEPIVTTKFEYL